MRRRGSRGGSMRSVVGFLSQRGLEGDPLLTHDFQRRRLRGCRNLYKKDLLGHFGCVNAIEFSNNGGQWLVSGKANALVPRPLPLPPLPRKHLPPRQPPLRPGGGKPRQRCSEPFAESTGARE
ncbi:DDB1- and CUL4-associated factor 5-like [Geothlypis trichas]